MYRNAEGYCIPEIIYPGSFLDYSLEITLEVEALKNSVENHLSAAAFYLFEYEKRKDSERVDENRRKIRTLMDDRELRGRIKKKYLQDNNLNEYHQCSPSQDAEIEKK